MTNIRCGGTTFHLSYCQHLKVSHASFVKWAISTKDAKYKWTKETTYPSEVTYMFNIFKSSSILCLTEIFIMETIFVLQCQDVTQHVSINYYQVLFLVLRNITRLKSRTASIYAKNRNHTFETGIVNADYANGGCFCLYACAVCGIGK